MSNRSRLCPSSQIIINLPFLISHYYYPCIYIWVNFAFKALFLCSSGTRESFILLTVSIQAFGRKQRQQNDREKWISWTNVTWVLFPFFHFQPSLLHPWPPPPNTHIFCYYYEYTPTAGESVGKCYSTRQQNWMDVHWFCKLFHIHFTLWEIMVHLVEQFVQDMSSVLKQREKTHKGELNEFAT